jgi:hypothetical protein
VDSRQRNKAPIVDSWAQVQYLLSANWVYNGPLAENSRLKGYKLGTRAVLPTQEMNYSS